MILFCLDVASITYTKEYVVTCVRFSHIIGRCPSKHAAVHTLSRTDFATSQNRLAIVLKRSNTNGAATLGVLNNVSATASKHIIINNHSVAKLHGHSLVTCQQVSVKFIFRFCGLIPGLATLRGIRLTSRVYPSRFSPTSALRGINLNSQLDGFPTRLSNNRRRHISVTHTVTGGPGLLLYSRPANTLSCRANGRILRLLRSVYHSRGVAILVVARGSTLTPVTRGIIHFHSNGIINRSIGPTPAPVTSVR